MEWLTCRVQFVNDKDPFGYTSIGSLPEPTRPPLHTFRANLPLVDQLAAVHRLLKAPHQVNCCLLCTPPFVHTFEAHPPWPPPRSVRVTAPAR